MAQSTTTDTLVTRSGVRLHVRPAAHDDIEALGRFFARMTPEDLRFRFLTGMREVSHNWLSAMATANDDRQSNSLIAFDDEGEIIATAMLVGDEHCERGEAAIALRGDSKNRGIGWTLLDHLVGYARRRGYRSVESIEHRTNNAAISLEKEMGFQAIPLDDNPTLVRLRRVLDIADAS